MCVCVWWGRKFGLALLLLNILRGYNHKLWLYFFGPSQYGRTPSDWAQAVCWRLWDLTFSCSCSASLSSPQLYLWHGSKAFPILPSVLSEFWLTLCLVWENYSFPDINPGPLWLRNTPHQEGLPWSRTRENTRSTSLRWKQSFELQVACSASLSLHSKTRLLFAFKCNIERERVGENEGMWGVRKALILHVHDCQFFLNSRLNSCRSTCKKKV